MRSLHLVFILFILSYTPWSFAQEIPVEHFAKGAQYFNLKLSPNGDFFSAKSKVDGRDVLAVFDRKAMKMMNVIRFGGNQQVGDYFWVNDKRIVTQIEYVHGWDNEPRYRGELFAVNADGSKQKYLTGYQGGEMQTGSRLKKGMEPIRGWAYVLDPLVEDKRYMLVTITPWDTKDDPYIRVYRVDVNTGKRKEITTAPMRSARYLTDSEGEVRFAFSRVDFLVSAPHYRKKGEDEWTAIESELTGYQNVVPVAFTEDGESVYISASYRGEPKALYQIDLKSFSITEVSKNAEGSITNVWASRDTKDIYAVEYEVGYPTYEFVQSKTKLAKRLKSFLQALPGHQVRIVSSTLDDSVQIIWAGNDKNPGDYYVFDESKKGIGYLLSQKNWLSPDKMADIKPIKFTARDGLTIHGYLTLPKGLGDKKAPLIVNPHGGPEARDWWSYSDEVQLLANRGYAVLNINFRGSSGFGGKFMTAGYKKWGSDIQYDIIDGVKYVLENEPLDSDNVCILGGSFGGYSALQSAILEPELFKCAVGVVGVYDLELLYKEGDIQRTKSGVNSNIRRIGTDKAQMAAFSPARNAEKLTVPVLIVHGEEDDRAPIEHAEVMIKALKKHDKEYEYLEFDTEGHGFYKSEHRVEYYNKVLEFLAKHIKK